MKTLNLLNYAQDGWYQASGGLAEVQSAITGEVIATTGSQGLDFKAMLDHGRQVGGPALRRLTFHERAHMLKALAGAIMARKGGAVRAQLPDRRHPHRRLDRH
jgi:oxepin-CoA hydrolase/3-oxo-5,6-dehydrosuberyl-CoA semialdehyde dehydrogenase